MFSSYADTPKFGGKRTGVGRMRRPLLVLLPLGSPPWNIGVSWKTPSDGVVNPVKSHRSVRDEDSQDEQWYAGAGLEDQFDLEGRYSLWRPLVHRRSTGMHDRPSQRWVAWWESKMDSVTASSVLSRRQCRIPQSDHIFVPLRWLCGEISRVLVTVLPESYCPYRERSNAIHLLSVAADKHKGHFSVTAASESQLSRIEPASISIVGLLIMIISRLFASILLADWNPGALKRCSMICRHGRFDWRHPATKQSGSRRPGSFVITDLSKTRRMDLEEVHRKAKFCCLWIYASRDLICAFGENSKYWMTTKLWNIWFVMSRLFGYLTVVNITKEKSVYDWNKSWRFLLDNQY